MMNEIFASELLPNERVLWSGQPDPKVFFSKIDIFLIPFSLMWGGFALVWEVMAIIGSIGGAPIYFLIFGIPFVVFGCYITFGRFIYKNYKKKNTYYAVTDKRVLILTKTNTRQTQAIFIDSIPAINKSINKNGFGTVRFGHSSPATANYGNTGLDFFSSFNASDVPTFYDIADAGKVYEMVNQIKAQKGNETQEI